MNIWNLWLPLAFVEPLLLAGVYVLDLYFRDGLYQDEWDGTLISGGFQVLPWVLVFAGIVPFKSLALEATLYALAGGMFFLGSLFFYFRALFRHADSPLILILWSGAVLVVPLMSWAWFHEVLLPMHYLGIALAFGGATVFALPSTTMRGNFLRVAGSMLWAVVLFSGAMVMQKQAYQLVNDRFLDVYLVFSLGAGLATLLLALINPKRVLHRMRRFASFERKFILLFVLAELLSFAGTLVSQRTIELAPSVSFVAAIESSVPVFVMLLSLTLSLLLARLGHLSMSSMFRQQTDGWRRKLAAMLLMTLGIYCIAG